MNIDSIKGVIESIRLLTKLTFGQNGKTNFIVDSTHPLPPNKLFYAFTVLDDISDFTVVDDNLLDTSTSYPTTLLAGSTDYGIFRNAKVTAGKVKFYAK